MEYSSKESILHFKIDNKRMISAFIQRNDILFDGFVIRLIISKVQIYWTITLHPIHFMQLLYFI